MTNKAMLKVAVSSLIFSMTLASCSSSTLTNGPAKLTQKAEKSLAKGKTDKAIVSGEEAVLIAPRDAEARRVLANAYLQDGRFLSAEKTFEDAMALGDNSARTIISTALSRIAQGKQQQALNLLNDKRTVLPPSDYGLALALAGETGRGVNVLSDLIRSGVNSPKVRQNLAFAYALDGRWREAKLMAGQDVKPDDVNDRILQWAQLARPDAYEARVASLLGVSPAAVDGGQPVQLALRPQSDNAKAVAIAVNGPVAPVVAPPVTAAPKAEPKAEQKPITLASAAPVALPLPKAAPKPAPASAPVIAKKKPIVENASVAPSRAARPAPAPAAAPAPRSSPQRVKQGSYILQLGAFSSKQGTQKAWTQLTRKYRELGSFGNASSAVTSNGRTLYRLAATGFGNEQSAIAMCDGIKARGGSCIVRKAGGAKGSSQLAARR